MVFRFLLRQNGCFFSKLQVLLVFLLFCFLSSCSKQGIENEVQVTEAVSKTQTYDSNANLSKQEINEVVLNEFLNVSGALINLTSPISVGNVKLLCISNSFAYKASVVSNLEIWDFSAEIDGKKLIIYAQGDNLINLCENHVEFQNLNLKVSKLGIRYNDIDYELPYSSSKLSPLKITTSFIDAIHNPLLSNIQIYCKMGSQDLFLQDLPNNYVIIPAKKYLDHGLSNLLFFNLDRLTIQNSGAKFQGYTSQDSEIKSQDISFLGCTGNMFAKDSVQIYKKLYFKDDAVPLYSDDFLLVDKPLNDMADYQKRSLLVCHFIDENGKDDWHWGFSELEKYRMEGEFKSDGFHTNEKKDKLENICKNYSKKYDKGSWALSDIKAAKYYWSQEVPVYLESSPKAF